MSRYSRINQSVLKSPQQTSNRTSVLSPSSTNFIEFTPQRSTRKAALFSNDQEIFLDCATPLILVSDNNILNPSCRPSGKFIPAIPSHVGSAERLDTESRKSERESKPRTSVWSDGGDVSASAAPSGRKARLSQSQMSNSQGFQKAKAIADSPEKAAVGDSSNAVDIFKTEEDVKEENIFKKKLKNFLDSTHFNITVGLFIFYALFADDFRVLLLNSSADLGFDVVLLLVLAIFSFEIVANLIVDKNYLWSFFFWLDIVSTVSIIFDVRLISNDFFPDGAKNTAQLARASRAARIGTRAGRVVRIFRLVRLAKVYKPKDPKQKGKATLDRGQSLEKVYPAPGDEMNPDSVKLVRSGTLAPITRKPTLRMQQSIREKDPIIKRAQSASEEVEDKQELKESRVGKRLSDLTTKRVVVIVLALLLFIPFFSADFYFDAPASQEYEATLLNLLLSNSSVSDNAKTAAIQSFMSQELANEPSLVYLQIGTEMLVPNANTVDLDNPADLRDDEQEIDTETGSSRGDIISIVSSSPKTRLEAGLNMLRTVFVCLVLIVGALLFSKDANTLVLRPIERMIEKVNKIAGNPMIAKEEALIRDKNDGLENETIQIENAIIKIGGLLALGFGDAGSVIVTQNMARSDDLNAIVLGRKELAIFGFCDIRNFTDATEVLQEDVMVFVNSIAEVVHSVVDLHTGAANKNIGDAFLLVWKFPESEIVENDDLNLEVRDSKITQAVADLALISFLKINIKINRDPKLLAYRSNAALNVRLPNYQVKMGFGLHVGWAIEGAIGSEFKVDASYLSPNVNLASRLEAATKQYGVPLLFSGELYNRLSMEMREKSRLIDIVTVKGSSVPMEIYTVDMDVNGLTPLADTSEMTTTEKREIHKLRKKKLWDDITEKSCTSLLENDYELSHAFRNHSPEFNDVFAQGFQAYIQGDWAIAKKKFEQSLSLQKEDGPTKNLLGFLKENDYIAPEDWDGYHVLTEK